MASSSQSGAPPGAPGSYEHFEKDLAKHTRQAAESWAKLQKIIDKDYDSLCKRWRALSRENRATILGMGFGGSSLPRDRRPDLNGVWDVHENRWTWPAYAFLFPHLSEEDLVYGDIIPTFLFNRGTRHWTEYSQSDLYSARGGTSQPNFHGFVYMDEKDQRENAPLLALYHPPSRTVGKLIRFKKGGLDFVQDIKQRRGAEEFDVHDYCDEFDAPEDVQADDGLTGPKSKTSAIGRNALDKFSWSQALQVARIQARVYYCLVNVCLALMFVPVSSKVYKEKLAKATSDETSEETLKEISKKISAQLKSEVWQEQKVILEKEVEQYKHQGKSYKAPPAGSAKKENRVYTGALPKLTEMRLEAYYGPPDSLDWEGLGELIDSKVHEAKTSLLRLRRDPDVFEHSIRLERWIRDPASDWTMEPQLEPKPREFANKNLVSWKDATKFCIGNAINDFDRSSEIQDAFINLKQVWEQQRPTLEAGRDADDKTDEFWEAAKILDVALHGFYLRAREFSEIVVEELNTILLGSEFYHKIFRFKRTSGLKELVLQEDVLKEGPPERIEVYNKLRRILRHDRVQFGLSALLDDLERARNKKYNEDSPDAPEAGPYSRPDSFLEHAAGQDAPVPAQAETGEGEAAGQEGGDQPKKKKKKKKPGKSNADMEYLTEDVLRIVGDLSFFAECICQAERFQPWARLYFADWNDHPQRKDANASIADLKRHFAELRSERPWRDVLELGLPQKHRFYYPIGEEKTEENVIQLQEAEENLDRYWTKVLKELGPDCQDALTERTKALLDKQPSRTTWRVEQPHAGDEDEEMPDIETQEGPKEKEQGVDVEMTDPTGAPKTPSPPGKRAREEEEEPAGQSPTKVRKTAKAKKGKGKEKEDEPLEILLPRKVYPDLRFLFHDAGSVKGGRTIKWKDLCNLLVNMGFSGRPHRGSEWKFNPATPKLISKLADKKRGEIAVHSPHPHNYLDISQTRSYGDTMKDYGLNYDMFASR